MHDKLTVQGRDVNTDSEMMWCYFSCLHTCGHTQKMNSERISLKQQDYSILLKTWPWVARECAGHCDTVHTLALDKRKNWIYVCSVHWKLESMLSITAVFLHCPSSCFCGYSCHDLCGDATQSKQALEPLQTTAALTNQQTGTCSVVMPHYGRAFVFLLSFNYGFFSLLKVGKYFIIRCLCAEDWIHSALISSSHVDAGRFLDMQRVARYITVTNLLPR